MSPRHAWLNRLRVPVGRRARGQDAGFARAPGVGSDGDPGRRGRQTWGRRQMETLLFDIRFGLRSLRRDRSFTLTAAITLALGIGATSAVFTVTYAVLLRPFPYPQLEQLVVVRAGLPGGGSAPALLDAELRGLATIDSLSDVAAVAVAGGELTGAGDAGMERVPAVIATDNLLPLLGVQPLLGRHLDGRRDVSAEDAPLGVLISQRLWERRYGADPGAVGRAIELNNALATVVGIVPDSFRLHLAPGTNVPALIDVWVPRSLDAALRFGTMTAVARLAPGVTLERANAEVAVASRNWTPAVRGIDGPRPLSMVRLQVDAVEEVRGALLALTAAVVLVLIIACVNVSHLILIRTTGRAHEFAIRSAIGAGRLRLGRHLLTEGLVIAIAGGGLGVLMAHWAQEVLAALRPATLPAVRVSVLNGTVLAVATGMIAGCALVCNLAPLWSLARHPVRHPLQGRGRGPARAQARFCHGLIAAEVALSVVLLSGAGLMLRTMVNLRTVDLGLQPARVLTVPTPILGAKFVDTEEKWRFYQEVVERIARLPGVRSVSAARPLPLEGVTFPVQVVPDSAPVEAVEADLVTVLPSYFQTMGVRLLDGRDFTTGDLAQRRDVLIVDDQLAQAVWPGQSAVGRSLRFRRGARDGPPIEVIGVVAHVRSRSLREAGAPQLYVPYHARAVTELVVAVRTDGDPMALAGPVRQEVEALGGLRPVHTVRPMTDYLAEATAETRFSLTLLAVFATLAVVLTAVGAYGVVAFSTALRTREIGIRIACGAGLPRVVRSVAGGGLRSTLLGLIVGLGATAGLTRFVRAELYEVSRLDPLTLGGVSILLGVCVMAGCLIPALRAARMDPMAALRPE